MRMRHLIGAVTLALALAACSGSTDTGQTTAQSTPTSPTTTAGSSLPSTPTAPAAGPTQIMPRQGEIPYLTSNPNGAYTCWQGMSTVAMTVSEEAGKAVVTTYNQTEFSLKRSDNYYWLSFPRTYMVVMAVIVNDKYGFDMPIDAWNPDTGSGANASLHLGNVTGKKLNSFKLCVATPF